MDKVKNRNRFKRCDNCGALTDISEEIFQAIDQLRCVGCDVGMGVSKWMNHGKKFGYDKFFIAQERDEILKDFETIKELCSEMYHECPRKMCQWGYEHADEAEQAAVEFKEGCFDPRTDKIS